MNKRIRELAEQAQQYAEYVTPQGLECFDTFKEKFAELIINECAVIADMGWAAPGTQIKQHFGVDQ